MSKNKLILSLALIFVLLSIIPIAHAQATGTARIVYILINAAVVAMAIILIQSFLVPNKEGKEKTSMWVITVIASFIVALLYGQNDFLWRSGPLSVFFSAYVLVNSILIGAVIYLILVLIKVEPPKSGPGMVGYGIILFLVSVIFALQIGNSWIWQIAILQGLLAYLFGAEGILNPAGPAYRLWVFIGASTLIAFFFNGFLITDGVGANKKIGIALSVVLAANMASQGASLWSVIQLGEIFFVILLASSLKKTFESQRWAIFWAVFLVAWASAALTASSPAYRGLLGSMACATPMINCDGGAGVANTVLGYATIGIFGIGLFGTIISIAVTLLLAWGIPKLMRESNNEKMKQHAGKVQIGLLILAALVIFTSFSFLLIVIPAGLLLALYMFSEPEAAAREGEKKHNWLREGFVNAYNWITGKVKENDYGASALHSTIGSRQKTLPGHLPPAFKQLRVQIFTLMNYILRHEIFKAKLSTARKLAHSYAKEYEQGMSDLAPTPEVIHQGLKNFVEGAPIRKTNPDGKWELVRAGLRADLGFGRSYYIILKIMEQLKQKLEAMSVETEETGGYFADSAVSNEITTWRNSELATITGQGLSADDDNASGLEVSYKRYKAFARRFRTVNRIRSDLIYFLDMYALHGEYKRGYRYAKKGTLPQLCTWKLKGINDETGLNEGDNGVQRSIDWSKVEPFEDATTTENYEPKRHDLIEVDIYGYSTTDINKIQIDRQDIPRIRKWKKSDITYLNEEPARNPKFNEILDFATKDWEYWVDDITKGSFHPYSKDIVDYTALLSVGNFNVRSATFKRILDRQRMAFDLEAIKFQKFIYWGRKNYYDSDISSMGYPPKNPYPAVSLKGLWAYIEKFATEGIDETDEVKKYLQYFKMAYPDVESSPAERGDH
jgi:hypothetical protein